MRKLKTSKMKYLDLVSKLNFKTNIGEDKVKSFISDFSKIFFDFIKTINDEEIRTISIKELGTIKVQKTKRQLTQKGLSIKLTLNKVKRKEFYGN